MRKTDEEREGDGESEREKGRAREKERFEKKANVQSAKSSCEKK